MRPVSQRPEDQVLEQVPDDMLPEVLDQLVVDQLQPPGHHVGHVPKGSTHVSVVDVTYRLPVLSPLGFKFTDLKNAKAYSAGAAAYEYGAEMQTLKPSVLMYLSDSAEVW